MKKLLYAATVLLYFSACTVDDYKTINTEGQYSLEVPTYMKEVRNLHPDASFQYANILKEVYIIVIRENISAINQMFRDNNLIGEYPADLNGYSKYLINRVKDKNQRTAALILKDANINGYPAKLTDGIIMANDNEAYFKFAYIQGSEYYYQITAWTLPANKNSYKNVFDRIFYSFKEL